MKILYVLSTLKNSGPVNQLYNVIENNKKACNATILTLSTEPSDTRIDDFRSIGVECISLNLSRLEGLFKARSKLKDKINMLSPDIIHSQGIRADGLLSGLYADCPWVVTAHNYPKDDYPMKFGRFKGYIMSELHIKSLAKCKHLISCSKSIQQQLSHHSVNSVAIQNGVKLSGKRNDFRKIEEPVFVTVGSLIARKNMGYIINAFKEFSLKNSGRLHILGDGPQISELKALAGGNDRIVFFGNVNNVSEHLLDSDIFISSSLSEGLPNTVLEALSSGLNCFLSKIPSHEEIKVEFDKSVHLFDLSERGDETSLLSLIENYKVLRNESSQAEAYEVANDVFSANSMSDKYFNFYKGIIE